MGATAPDECPFYTSILDSWNVRDPHSSLEDLAEYSLAVYTGTVTGYAEAFLLGDAATLLEVDVWQVLELAPGFSGGLEIYMHHPQARFTVGRTLFCNVQDELPPLPRSATTSSCSPTTPLMTETVK